MIPFLGGIKTRFLNVEPEVLEAATLLPWMAALACDVMQGVPWPVRVSSLLSAGTMVTTASRCFDGRLND